MTASARPVVFFAALIIACFVFALWPQLDLIVSGWFYAPESGFFLAEQPLLVVLHVIAVKGAWLLGAALAFLAMFARLRKKKVLGVDAKGWLFLLLALLLGPVLTANAVLKDHWGRARPREVVEFGGQAHFSSALAPQANAHRNGSFVAGDGAFGFFLPSFAYIAPKRRGLSRRVFWGSLIAGSWFGIARILMGGHFASDVLFAALSMLAISAGLHAALFGSDVTRKYWRGWFGASDKE